MPDNITDMDQEITIADDGTISGLTPNTPPEVHDDANWEPPADSKPPKDDALPADDDPDDDAPAGDNPTEEDDGWEDDKPTAKPDPDDVPPEDRDPKGKVPSWRVREIREKADREIAQLRAENEALKAAPPKPANQLQTTSPDSDPRQQAAAQIAETDPVVKDCDAKLAAIQNLVENAPEELPKYFRNGDHLQAEITRLTALRTTQINSTLHQRERDSEAQQTRETEAQAQRVTKLVTDYEASIKGSKIPGIEKYAQRLAQNAGKLNVGIRELILSADDKDVVTAAIGSNRKLFDELASLDPAKPLTAMQLASTALKLGKAIAKYQAPVRETVVDEPEHQPERAIQATATRRASRATPPSSKIRYERDGTIVM